jgi:hypothetical protein
MPTSRKNKRTRKAKRNNKQNIPATSLVYTGPITAPMEDTTTVVLRDNAVVTCSALGAIAAVFNNSPSNARNWTEYSTSWVEYRTLGIKYSYFPIANAPSATLNGFSGYHGVGHGIMTQPTTLAEASSTGRALGWNAFQRFVHEWRMASVDEADWLPCAFPTSTSDTLVLYAQGAGVSLTYGDILIEYLVQFRTHAR